MQQVARFEVLKQKITERFCKSNNLEKVPLKSSDLAFQIGAQLYIPNEIQSARDEIRKCLDCLREVSESEAYEFLSQAVASHIQQQNMLYLFSILKNKIVVQFIRTFDFTTLVFLEEGPSLFSDKLQAHPIKSICRVIESNSNSLNIDDEGIETLMNIISNFIDGRNSEILANPECKSIKEAFLRDKSSAYKILDTNFRAFLEITSAILSAYVRCFQLGMLRDVEYFLEKKQQFIKYIKSSVINNCKTVLQGVSYKKISTQCLKLSKSILEGIQHQIKQQKQYKDMSLIGRRRHEVRDHYLEEYNSQIQKEILLKFNYVLQKDLFLEDSTNFAKKEFERLISNLILEEMKNYPKTDPSIIGFANHLIQIVLSGDIVFEFFPNDRLYVNPNEILSHSIRVRIVKLFLLTTPSHISLMTTGKLREEFWCQHQTFLREVINSLQLREDQEVKSMLHNLNNINEFLNIEITRQAVLDQVEEELLKDQSINQFGVPYILFGLMNMITRLTTNLQNTKKCDTGIQSLDFEVINYPYREYLLRISRRIKNGVHGILNCNTVLLIERAWASLKDTQNKSADRPDNLFLQYHDDYDVALQTFKTIDLRDIGDILLARNSRIGERSFSEKFIKDVEFFPKKTLVDERNSVKKTHNMYKKRDSQEPSEPIPDLHEKYISKLRFLSKRVERMEFEVLNEPEVKSKVLMLCISGFLSEDEDKADDWRELVNFYPNNEVLSINWSASSVLKTAGNLAKGLFKMTGIGSYYVAEKLDQLAKSKREKDRRIIEADLDRTRKHRYFVEHGRIEMKEITEQERQERLRFQEQEASQLQEEEDINQHQSEEDKLENREDQDIPTEDMKCFDQSILIQQKLYDPFEVEDKEELNVEDWEAELKKQEEIDKLEEEQKSNKKGFFGSLFSGAMKVVKKVDADSAFKVKKYIIKGPQCYKASCY